MEGALEEQQAASPERTSDLAALNEWLQSRNLSESDVLRLLSAGSTPAAVRGPGTSSQASPHGTNPVAAHAPASRTALNDTTAGTSSGAGPSQTPAAGPSTVAPGQMPHVASMQAAVPPAHAAGNATHPSPVDMSAALLLQSTQHQAAAQHLEQAATANHAHAQHQAAVAHALRQASPPVASSGGHKGKYPAPDKFSYEDVQRGRKSRRFLKDVENYATYCGFLPVKSLSTLLRGDLRESWGEREDAYLAEHGKDMPWEDAQVEFCKLLGEDLIDTKEQARNTLFSSQLKQQPNELVRAYASRFRTAIALLGSEIAASTQIHLFVHNLSDTLYKDVGRQASGRAWETLDAAVQAACGAEDRMLHNAAPDAKRARTMATAAPAQAALALAAPTPNAMFHMPPPNFGYPYMPYAPNFYTPLPVSAPPPAPDTATATVAPVTASAAAPPVHNNRQQKQQRNPDFNRNGVQKPRYNNNNNNNHRNKPRAPAPPNPAPHHGPVPERVQKLYAHVHTHRSAILDANACLRCGSMAGENSTHHTMPHCDDTGPFFRALNLFHGDVPATPRDLPAAFQPPTSANGRNVQ